MYHVSSNKKKHFKKISISQNLKERGSFGLKCYNDQDCTTGNCNQITSTCGNLWIKRLNRLSFYVFLKY